VIAAHAERPFDAEPAHGEGSKSLRETKSVPSTATCPQKEQASAPLAEAVFNYASEGLLRLHMPGHKGRALSSSAQHLMDHAFEHDLTELPGLDDLFAASGPIEQAQRLAAGAFGSDQAFFLVGGASAGIISSLWAALSPGSTLALARNSHRSAVSALLLSGATPAWARGSFRPPLYLPEPVGAGELVAVAPRDVRCILLTSPTYDGLYPESARRAMVRAGAHGCSQPSPAGLPGSRPVVIVDEAHGAHMYFLEAPPGAAHIGARGDTVLALEQDVDACVHGAHKTLGSLTGTGLLHLKGTRLDPGRVRQALLTVQTSSPSYLMMASLDLARRDMVLNGRVLLAAAVSEAESARQSLLRAGIDYFRPGGPSDLTRLVIGSVQFGMTGAGLYARLRDGGVQAEYAGLLYVVFVFSIGDAPGSGTRLVEALERIRKEPGTGRCGARGVSKVAVDGSPAEDVARAVDAAQALAGVDLPVRALTPRQAWTAKWREVPLSQSVGRVAAESVFTYPPGSALLVAGEIVPPWLPGMVEEFHLLEGHFQGPADRSLGTLRVVEG